MFVVSVCVKLTSPCSCSQGVRAKWVPGGEPPSGKWVEGSFIVGILKVFTVNIYGCLLATFLGLYIYCFVLAFKRLVTGFMGILTSYFDRSIW